MIALISKVLVHVNACPLSKAQGTEHPQPLPSAQTPPLQSSAPAQTDVIPTVCDSSTSNAHATQHKQATHPSTPHAPCESKAVKNKDNKTLLIGRGGRGDSKCACGGEVGVFLLVVFLTAALTLVRRLYEQDNEAVLFVQLG